MSKIIYHYSSLAGFYGIINSKSLWLTSLHSTNDKKELAESKKVVIEAIGQLKKSQQIDEKIEVDLSQIKEHNYFSSSFVKSTDSLTHWERYGDSCTGMCVAFESTHFDNLIKIHNTNNNSLNVINFKDVLYSKEEQLKAARANLLLKVKLLKSFQDDQEDLIDMTSTLLCSSITELAPLFKHWGFANESEFRIFYNESVVENHMSLVDTLNRLGVNKQLHNMKSTTDEYSTIISKLGVRKYNMFQNQIRAYYEFSLEKIWSSMLIPKVIIGPKCSQNVKELRGFLDSNNLTDTQIAISEIPIR